MSTQTTHCNSAYVLEIGQADLTAKDLEKKNSMNWCSLSFKFEYTVYITLKLIFLEQQSLKRRNKYKAKLDSYLLTNFGLQDMAKI